jgi:hypothetical protein
MNRRELFAKLSGLLTGLTVNPAAIGAAGLTVNEARQMLDLDVMPSALGKAIISDPPPIPTGTLILHPKKIPSHCGINIGSVSPMMTD